MSFAATANCVLHQGGRVVFADVCSDTLNLDPERVVERITPQTRAVLPVDYAGTRQIWIPWSHWPSVTD